ncbi:hypothetical protein IT570_03575 [Candidatus Sumerlaeota bacterium]|nr:hypothetical protein [Candidatus Sumerlaeota bacterium]
MDPRFISSLTEAMRVDGVYIYEIDPPGYITGVGTSVVGMVGDFEMGPIDQVISIGSSAEFSDNLGGYGKAPSGSETTWRGYSGFRAISGKAWPAGIRIVRPSRTAMAKATGTFNIPSSTGYKTVTATAKWMGNYGNGIVLNFSAASDSSLTDGFRITASCGGKADTLDNLYAGMSVGELQERTKNTVLVDLTIGAQTVGSPDTLPGVVTLASGSDGTGDVLLNWTNAIDKLFGQRDLNILFYAEAPGSLVTNAALNSYIKGKLVPTGSAAQFVVAVLSGPVGDSIDTAATAAAGLRSDRIIYSWPYRKQVYADASPAFSNGRLTVPSSDAIASALANIDPIYDPASRFGTKFINAATDGLEFDSLTRETYVKAKEQGICALEYDPDMGYRVVSGITTDLTPAKEMIHRRRTSDYLTRSVSSFLKFYENQPITQDWKDDVYGAVYEFLKKEQELKPTPRILGFDLDIISVNSANTEAQGIFNILMKVRIPGSARFIVLMAQVGTTVEVKVLDDLAA